MLTVTVHISKDRSHGSDFLLFISVSMFTNRHTGTVASVDDRLIGLKEL